MEQLFKVIHNSIMVRHLLQLMANWMHLLKQLGKKDILGILSMVEVHM